MYIYCLLIRDENHITSHHSILYHVCMVVLIRDENHITSQHDYHVCMVVLIRDENHITSQHIISCMYGVDT